MMIFRFEVDAPEHAVPAIKECLEMQMEQYGDVRLVSVEAAQEQPSQMSLSAWAAQRGYKEAAMRRR